ncbi:MULTISPECIES: hypothetical protein [Bacillus cereus group]|nr:MULTISPECIES: hypothetical protein [Bacillus cereus group]
MKIHTSDWLSLTKEMKIKLIRLAILETKHPSLRKFLNKGA